MKINMHKDAKMNEHPLFPNAVPFKTRRYLSIPFLIACGVAVLAGVIVAVVI